MPWLEDGLKRDFKIAIWGCRLNPNFLVRDIVRRMEYLDKQVKRIPASEEALRLMNLEKEFYLLHETKKDIHSITVPKFIWWEINTKKKSSKNTGIMWIFYEEQTNT